MRRLKKHAYYDEDAQLMADLGPELYEYFEDERLMKKPKQGKRKKKARFKVGEQVEIRLGASVDYGTIIYGPYEGADNVHTYEIEKEDGEIVTQADINDQINKYVPPAPEKDDDEF